jgi:CP family cyanate transporter-like MFS transporter
VNPKFALLWITGLDLRITLLALPPVLPLIHRDLGLSESGVAALSNLPVLMLALSSIFGSLSVAKLGPRHALVIGIWTIAISSALRGAGHSIFGLFAATFVMGLGIALIQPAFPALSRDWFPARVPLATAVWANGLVAGEALGASLTLPLVLPLVAHRWDWSFVVWGAFVALTALLLMATTRREPPHDPLPGTRWFPDFRSPLQWQLGILQAAASIAYFGANAFVPDYLHATNAGNLVGPALSALNIAQLPASLVVGLVPLRILALPASSFGVAGLLALAILAFLAGGAWTVVGAALVGFGAAYILIVTFALPPLIAGPRDVARLSAGTFTIAYAAAFLVSLGAGALWDATHHPVLALLPIACAPIIVVALGPALSRAALTPRSAHEAHETAR